jgi:hypothetical protein
VTVGMIISRASDRSSEARAVTLARAEEILG